MLDRIESWRTKPTSVKQRYALTTAVIATIIIAGIWSTTLPSRLTVFDFSNHDEVVTTEKPEVAPSIVPPAVPGRFSMFTASVMNGFTVLKEKVTGAPPELVAEPVATTTPMVWNEVIEASNESAQPREGKPIMIAVATTSASTSDTVAATTSEAVIQ